MDKNVIIVGLSMTVIGFVLALAREEWEILGLLIPLGLIVAFVGLIMKEWSRKKDPGLLVAPITNPGVFSFCPYCGVSVAPGSVSCPSCGRRLPK